MCPSAIEPGSAGKTLYRDQSGEVTTCGDYNDFIASQTLPSCGGYVGTLRGIDVPAYCDCTGTSYPQGCGVGLCPDGGIIQNSNGELYGLTCAEWDDWARAATTPDVCSRLTKQQALCCDGESNTDVGRVVDSIQILRGFGI